MLACVGMPFDKNGVDNNTACTLHGIAPTQLARGFFDTFHPNCPLNFTKCRIKCYCDAVKRVVKTLYHKLVEEMILHLVFCKAYEILVKTVGTLPGL